MSEPTRPIRQPTVDADGSLVAHSVATPKAFKVRAKVTVGSRRVIPVIFVPGIMGTNLRGREGQARGGDRKPGAIGARGGRGAGPPDQQQRSKAVPAAAPGAPAPGEPVWRPPNGVIGGIKEAKKWKRRDPAARQQLLNPELLEVDGGGDLGDEAAGLSHAEMRARGWGEVHLDSYGEVLEKLQTYLDTTFRVNKLGQREIRVHWKRVMQCDPAAWGVRKIARITEAELEKFAAFQYPVYAVGYNWLESCAVSAQRLNQRIDEIKKFWRERKHECNQVILVTHSMGGLVARASARMRGKSPDDPADIAGIIHGVMPALGAPVAYRRIACGTEGGRFANDLTDNLKEAGFVDIAGATPAETTAVMATAPGVLELLPNHLYPKPWLLVKTLTRVNNEDREQGLLALPSGNPYDMYRDTTSWYRLFDLKLADPAGRYKETSQDVTRKVEGAIRAAEHLHRAILSMPGPAGESNSSPYFHPNSYVFYGSDPERRAYGTVQWAARVQSGQAVALTPANLRGAVLAMQRPEGSREVLVEGRMKLHFQVWGQDAPGDDTVPMQSGAGCGGHVREVYAARGFGHQDSFKNDAMLLLTRHLIVKIVQGIR